jgi:hypothetical protein
MAWSLRKTTSVSVVALLTTVLAGASHADAGASRAAASPGGLHAVVAGAGPAAPYLSWSPVRGADHYEMQLAADSSFRAPIAAGDVKTGNTRATLTKTLPSHRYYWRVQGVSKSGSPLGWATGSFAVAWRPQLKQLSTKEMRWAPVAGAVKYSVEISADPSFAASSLVGGKPLVTSATAITPPVPLTDNKYYWRVTPLDAEGNTPVGDSPVWTVPPGGLGASGLGAVDDCIKAGDLAAFGPGALDAVFCPVLSWRALQGAAKYEVEINPDSHWAAGSRACCSGTTAATRYTPTVSLPSNKYYWRVRGIDPSGNAGPWFGPDPNGVGTDADAFTKTFGNVCRPDLTTNCLPAPPSIAGLRVEDAAGGSVGIGGATGAPVVRWNPVVGASSYEWEVTPYSSGGCDWSDSTRHLLRGVTATSAWTPLGSDSSSHAPYPPGRVAVAHDSTQLQLVPDDQYCFRVRAQTDRDPHGGAVIGDFTYLPDADHPSFRFTGYPGSCSSGASARIAGGTVTPDDGRQMPLFRWAPTACVGSYWIIVARDASFTNLVDYASTREPAYAPRKSGTAMTYSDETTAYYWVVLPDPCFGSACDPLSASVFQFQKQVPPAALQLAAESPQPTFSWDPVPGARRYELQVSQDPHFGSSFVEKVTTVATSYTATATYPAGKQLFWRVRADDENLVGLSWANWAEGHAFTVKLPVPANPRVDRGGGAALTTLRWDPVDGASSYDVHVQVPKGSGHDYSNLHDSRLTLSSLSGTGAFRWQVRAKFARGFSSVAGPYTALRSGTQTVFQPTGVRVLASGRGVILLWMQVPYARAYRVQVSPHPDFSGFGETVTTDNPSYAPKLGSAFTKGGRFYWRVAAIDSSGNTGKYTAGRPFAVAGAHH